MKPRKEKTMQREENGATTEGQTKLPQAGEYWQNYGGGDRVLIHGVTQAGAVLFEYESGNGAHICQSAFLQWWHHLPDCTGWDWVPEVWPKWYVHRDANQQWYVRRNDANNAVMVFGVAPDWDRTWHTEWDGHVIGGHWIEVSEAEAKARLTPLEVWPKYVIHVRGFACATAYLRRDSTTNTVAVRTDGSEYKNWWNAERDETINSGAWQYVTESEAKARLTPPVPVPVPAKNKIPLRAWVLSRHTKPDDMAAFWVTQGDLSAKGFTEVHGLQIYIENPLASGSVDDATEASALV